MRRVVLFLISLMTAEVFAAEEYGYLFSYFSNRSANGRKGESAGLHLAWSEDGRKWTALNDDEPILIPEVGRDKLMRDPSICQGPDGTFHLVWTSSWKDRIIGYSSSKDLVHWTSQRALPVMMNEPTARNTWAPEVTYNPDDGLFYIYWATTIPDRHKPIPDMDKKESGLNHRIYLTTTKDWQNFSPTRLWFNPDFSSIDAACIKDPKSKEWLMVVKNENHTPVEKNIRFYRTKDLAKGFVDDGSKPITDNWVEGPSPLFVGDELIVYFDRYRKGGYGAVSSKDGGKTWVDISKEVSFPGGIRHGTAFKVPKSVLEKLKTFDFSAVESIGSTGPELKTVPLSGLVMGAEKLVKYGERVKVDGVLTYLVPEGANFNLVLDEEGELKVVAVPTWWTPFRVFTVLGFAVVVLAALLGWALFLRHQKRAADNVHQAVQRERLRLSHDLHDGYQQLLAGCMFRLTAADTLYRKGAVDKAVKQMEGLCSGLTHAQDELRAVLWTMKEEAEGPMAMGELFKYAASRLPQWNGRVFFKIEGEERPISRQYAGTLLMIFQEAVGNALRHGEATRVDIKVAFGKEGIGVVIADNGKGFTLGENANDGGLHIGLNSMRARTEAIGGKFTISSIIGKGTTIRLTI